MDHYGKEKASTYKSVTVNQVGDIDVVAAIEEWLGFISICLKNIKSRKKSFKRN